MSVYVFTVKMLCQTVARFRNLDSRFRLTTDTRNSMQEAALCISTAQSILPGVQFPYCTNREITAILQVNIDKTMIFSKLLIALFSINRFCIFSGFINVDSIPPLIFRIINNHVTKNLCGSEQ